MFYELFKFKNLATVNLDLQLGEIAQHLGHFVAPLATPDVDDDVRVGEFRQWLGDDRLATAEGARDGRCSAFNLFNLNGSSIKYSGIPFKLPSQSEQNMTVTYSAHFGCAI